MIPNQFNNIFLFSDLNGTGVWRGLMPIESCWCLGPKTGISNSVLCKVSIDPNLYNGVNMVMVQRLVADQAERLYNGVFVPYSNKFRFWTIYNIDDLTDCRDIPFYNRGRRAYVSEKAQDNIRKMMNNSDFILVTTDYLKNCFHECYDIPLENIICVPNLLPRWWIGDYYRPKDSIDNFRKNKSKPRIGVVSSLSHYNIDHIRKDKNGLAVFEDKNPDGSVVYHNEKNEVVNLEECEEIEDDFDTILETVKDTIDDVQWVIFGYAPPKLEKEIKEKKVEVHGAIPILNYPSKLNSLKLNAIVAPLIQDSKFNKSKSNIKYLEACALGIPLFAPDMITYSPYMPASQLYKDSGELTEMVRKMKFMSATVYEDIISRQWKFLNSPFREAQSLLKNWWLEDNMDIWMKLFRLPQKSLVFGMQRFLEMRKEEEEKFKKASESSEILFKKPESDIEILK